MCRKEESEEAGRRALSGRSSCFWFCFGAADLVRELWVHRGRPVTLKRFGGFAQSLGGGRRHRYEVMMKLGMISDENSKEFNLSNG